MENLLLGGGARSASVNRLASEIIELFFTPAWQANWLTAIAKYRTQEDYWVAGKENENQPNYMVVSSSWGIAVFLSGTNGPLHLDHLVGGWLGSYDYPNLEGCSPGIAAGVDPIYQAVLSVGLPPGRKVIVCGHSFGGAVGMGVAAAVANNNNTGGVSCVSYGAPRPGNAKLSTLLRQVQNVRYYFADDPVRWIPPRCTESPVIHLPLSASQSNRIQTQQQPITGCQVALDGSQVWSEGGVIQSSAVEWSLFSWCAGVNGFRSLNHSITRYKAAFAAAMPLPPLPSPPVENPQINAGERVTLRSRAGFDLVAENYIMQAITAGTVPPVDVPVSSAGDPPLQRYRRKKIGKVWFVRWEDEIVATGPGKRKATKIARGLNKQLRAMAR